MSPSRPRPHGILLLNLGTPESPTPGAVRSYLREFLSDGRVLDIHPVARKLLLEAVVLPRRPRDSAHAYRTVWTEEGSPLRVHTRALAGEVARRLGPAFEVAVAMRYGRPAIEKVLPELLDRCTGLTVVPLYPHATPSTTGTALAEVYRVLGSRWDVPAVDVVPPWYDHPGFVGALARMYRETLRDGRPDHTVFSYHGIPLRHAGKSAPHAGCGSQGACCRAPASARQGCYRAQCVQTSLALAEALELEEGAWSTTFQSRFGRDPWIGPDTEATLASLARAGCRRVAVACPGFSVDCLETLEEMGIRGRETFLEAGGEAYTLLPCANADPGWADVLAGMIRETARVRAA